MDIKKIFAENIKAFREAKNLTQDDVAAKLGVNRSFISRMEKGENWPGDEKIDKLARLFQVPVVALFGGKLTSESVGVSNLEPLINKIEVTYDRLIEEKDKVITSLERDKEQAHERERSLIGLLTDLSGSFRSLNKV